jgi:hypothetical protein
MLEHHRIHGLLSHPTLFANGDVLKSFSDAYFAHAKGDIIPDPNSDEWFWEDACDFMFESLVEHIPSSRQPLGFEEVPGMLLSGQGSFSPHSLPHSSFD